MDFGKQNIKKLNTDKLVNHNVRTFPTENDYHYNQQDKVLKTGLYLVATPIGHLGDITLRSLDILKKVDIILCEDTRITGKLLTQYQIKTKRICYHEFNAFKIRPQIIERLYNGQTIALVSDSGTPLISDPGYKLVQLCRKEGFYITAAPGPSAPIIALILSGLPNNCFFYNGFLPSKTFARKKSLLELKNIPSTLIFLESPKRILNSLSDMAEILGGLRKAVIARELTKKFEEILSNTLDNLVNYYKINGLPKGEIIIVIGPPETNKHQYTKESIHIRLRQLLMQYSTKDAVKILSQETGWKKSDLYQYAIAILNTL